MFRGDVWIVDFAEPVGRRPAVIISSNALNPRLSSVTVVEITGTPGPPETHIEVDSDDGLTGRPRSFVNATGIHTVRKPLLLQQRGRLTRGTMAQIEEALCTILDIDLNLTSDWP